MCRPSMRNATLPDLYGFVPQGISWATPQFIFMGQSDSVFDAIVDHLSARPEYFIPFADRRMSCEKWIQGEILFVLRKLKAERLVSAFWPEKHYPGRRERCDIQFETDTGSHWVELEVVVTNYLGGYGINITDRVNHVIQDTERVKKMSGSESGYVLFLAYPFSRDESEKSAWARHLGRILRDEVLEDRRFWRIPVNERFYVYLHLLQVSSV